MFHLQSSPRYDSGMVKLNVVELQNQISSEFPDFRIREKNDSWLMKAIGFFLFVITFGKNKDFMERFVTTLGSVVYVPAEWANWSPMSQCIVLRHERVHMRQAREHGRLKFSFLYLFWPVPVFRAKWRTRFEQEAYEESIRAMYEYGEDPTNYVFRVRMIMHFTSSEYFWMWTKREDLEEWFDAAVSRTIVAKKN